MIKSQRRERVIRTVILALILPFFTSIVGPGAQTAYAADTCTGPRIIGVQYSSLRLETPEANLSWKRGTNTALNQMLPTMLEWKRGTRTALSVIEMADIALKDFKSANPSTGTPTIEKFDDLFDTQTAVNKAREWAANPCFLALIGPTQSFIAQAVIPIYTAAGIPILSPSATDPRLTTVGSSTFHRLALPEDPQDLRSILTLRALGITKPAIFEDDEQEENQISRWARNPISPLYSILEWKRGTPTVTSRNAIIADAKARGVNGYYFNGLSFYPETTEYDNGGSAWPLVGEFSEVCAQCSGLVFGEQMDAAYIDEKYFYDTGVEGARILATSVPSWVFAQFNSYSERLDMNMEGPFATPAYDAMRFVLEAIKAGNSTAQAVNTFINTKKYNGISGPVSFDANGELAGRSQIVMTVTNGKRVITSGLPANYVANGAISNHSATTPSTTTVALQIKDFDETATASRVDLHTGPLVKSYLVNATGQINLSIPNGTSYISLTPDHDTEIGIRRVQYQVVVTNGAVTSFTNFSSGAAITQSSSRYQVRLASPSAIGTVNSNVSYAGKSYQFQIEKTSAAYTSSYPWGRIRSDNKIYITAAARYNAVGYIWANEAEDWSKRGYSKETFTATQLAGNTFNFSINPPAAKITGQISGSFGPGSYAQIQPLVNNSYYRGFDKSPISSDGHFGFQKPDDRFETFTVKIYAYGDSGVRATATSTQFTYKASETKTVSNLAIALPANNVSGVVSLEGIGQPNLSVAIYRNQPVANSPGSFTLAHQFTTKTNSNGQFNVALSPDTYTVIVQGGNYTYFATSKVVCVVSSGSNVCNVALGLPTVEGTITGLTDITGGDIAFFSEVTPGNWGFTSKNVFAYIPAGGKFYGFIEPGTYLMRATVRTKAATYSLTAGKCIVPSTGKATCNIAFAPGLSFKLLNNDGQNFSGTLGIKIKNIDSATPVAGNKTTIRYNPSTGFTYPLLPGKYSITLDPHSNTANVGATSEFRFEFVNNAITSVFAVESQTLINPVNGVFTLRLAKPQFEALLLTNSGATVNYPSRVWLASSDGSTRIIGTTTNTGGYVYTGATRLGDGVYSLWTTPLPWSSNSGVESKRESFTVTNGNVAQRIELREQAPNVSGVVTGPSGPIAGVQVSFSSIEMKKLGYWYSIRTTTDTNGRYSVYLRPGESHGEIEGGFDRGVINLRQMCQVLDTGTVCNFAMKAPNVISKFTVNGKGYDYHYVQYVKVDERNTSFGALDSWGESAKFAAYLAPGKYRPVAGLYYRDPAGTSVRTYAVGSECIVPETGTVTCENNFTGANLNFSVYDYKGLAPIAANIGGNLELINDPRDDYKNPSFNNFGTRNSEKNYVTFLADGSYRLTVQPNYKDANIGNVERYLFDVTNGTVGNMRVEGTTETLQPVSGAYRLKLKSPAVSGRVVAPNGTTGIVDAEVRAELNGREYYDVTDSNGYFNFDLGSAVLDGTYVVTARAPYGNANFGESANINVVVANGVGTAVTVPLRTPNLIGVVRGPLGVSKGNWLNIYRVTPNGKLEYMRWGNQSTDNQGRYGFRLEPGEYSITTNDDYQNTGGTAVRDFRCTVPETGTVTCDINLIAPNVRGTFTKAGAAVFGYVEVQRKNASGIFDYIGKYTYSNQSGWVINLPNGVYRARGYSWDDEFYFTSKEFAVIDTSTVNAAIEIPSVNLTIQVVSANGVLQTNPTNEANSSIQVVKIEAQESKNHFGYVNNLRGSSGQIKLRLSDGNYYLGLSSTNAQIGTPKEYSALVESGTVTAIIDLKTGAPVAQNNGVYQLQMGQPTISGTVVAPNGTTPVPGAMVGYFADGQVCPWCERNRVSTGNNGYFGFGDVPDGQYQIYARPNSDDITKGKSDLTAVTITGGQPQNGLVVALRDANVSGTIRGIEGAIDGTYINVQRRDGYGKNGTPYGVYDLRANSQGNFGLYLEPGTYRFIASIYTNGWSRIKSGFSQDCVVLNAGSVTCDINVNTSNISMKIVNPGTQTVMQNAHIGVYAAQYDSNLSTTNPQVSQNSNGIYTSYLENAVWRVEVHGSNESSDYARTYYTATVENGAVTKVENERGETLTAVDGVYLLSPKSTNLRGAITFNGGAYTTEAYVRVQSDSNGWWNEVSGRWSYGGNFGLNVAPGTYRLVVDPYNNGATSGPVITTVYNCVVPESGTATCNVALSAGNLLGRIVDENGAVYRQAYINLYRTTDDGKWDYLQVSVNNGLFRSNLSDGKYRITVVPYWEVRGTYTENVYEIQVVNNLITTVRNTRTNETVTATNGTYDFVLGMPAIRGRVLAPGTSTTGVEEVEIRVGTDASFRNWQYSTYSARNGNFSLTVPDGTYVVQAVPFGKRTSYGKSETQTVVVTNGAIASPLTLRLREPNFFGRVVTPGANPVPVSGVNVNIWIDGEYFYTHTGSDGIFAAYVDQPNPNCPTNCSLQLGYYQSTEFSSKNYAINSIGNIGDKALGGVSTRVRVLAPASGSATTANRYGYVAIEQWSTSLSRYEWMPSSHTNELGIVGLGLDVGEKYRLTAYPGEGNYALFSPKVFEVESFSAIDSPTITIVFDRPNISLQVRNIAGARNMWGWYQVSKYNSSNAKYEYFKDGYLDDQGRGALLLPQGDYSVHFWPGKINAGVEKEILLSVDSASVVTGTSVANGVATVVLPNGNVSGFIRNQSAVGLGSVVITAVRDNDPTKMVSTVSSANGYYELNLDRTHPWTIKAIEPISASNGQYALAIDSPSNAATSSADITININP